MDCCNYLQYRHPYYDPQMFENGLYTRDYYGHPYQSYFTSPYYSQQLPCAAPFSDYVYNPKEARIRKAMREASRERTLGAAPIPSPRGRHQSQTWSSIPEEQLMMTPSPELRAPICRSPIFPSPPLGQFIPPINSYTKLVHVLPSSGWLNDSPTYMQHNPMAELQQHQANMWQQYQEPMRSCSGPTYMMDSPLNLYPDINTSETTTQKKCPEVHLFSNSIRPPEYVPTSKCDEEEHIVKNEKVEQNTQRVDDSPTLVDCDKLKQTETGLPTFQETVVVQNPFDKEDDVKLNKQAVHTIKRNRTKKFSKPLPDFNEAFGTTERGRFQSPPDPRLALNESYLNCFFSDETIRYTDYNHS